MVEGLFVAFAVANGAPLIPVVVLAFALFQPVPALVLVGIHAVLRRRRDPVESPAAVFCSAVADELRAGASTRAAVIAAAESVRAPDIGQVAVGAPMDQVAGVVAVAFPEVGPEVSACLSRSSTTGSPAADLFDEVAQLAMVEAELHREVRTAMAPARITALILVAAPVIAVTMTLAGGDVSRFLQTAPQRFAVAAGLVMVLGSVIVGAWMIRRA
jgi:Flp pilus assembly protein TadB